MLFRYLSIHLMAMAALFAPLPDSEIKTLQDHFKGYNTKVIRTEILSICVDMEILDAKETSYMMKDENVFWVHLAIIRDRYVSTANMPHVDERSRFPNLEFVRQSLDINRSWRLRLVELDKVNSLHHDQVAELINKLDASYTIWEYLRDAQVDYYYVNIKRNALQSLRDTLGDEAFYSGRMPPILP